MNDVTVAKRLDGSATSNAQNHPKATELRRALARRLTAVSGHCRSRRDHALGRRKLLRPVSQRFAHAVSPDTVPAIVARRRIAVV